MGNSSSTTKETQRANERAYIRSLGDRYPLGDAELRKWCWVCDHLSSATTPLPIPSSSLPPLSLLAMWSALYANYNPYNRQTQSSNTTQSIQSSNVQNNFDHKVVSSLQVMEAMNIVDLHILPNELSSHICQYALGISLTTKGTDETLDPMQASEKCTSIEQIVAFEESYYSIESQVNEHVSSSNDPYANTSHSSQSLEDFLEGISTSCGRRGSRTSLSKLFAIVCKSNSRIAKADASNLISTAYSLALAASYLKSAAANNKLSKGKRKSINWQDFAPQNNVKDMQSMVNSLKKQRQRGGGIGFDYSSSSNSTLTSSDESAVSLEEFNEWAETQAPMLGSALPTFLHVLFTFFSPSSSGDGKEPSFPPGVTPLWIPNLTIEQTKNITHTSPTSTFFSTPVSSSFDLFALSCTSLTLASGRWHRLFSSEANGLSCNRLMHSVMGYGGPTIIIIRSKDTSDKGQCCSCVFGAFTFTPWTIESSDFFGNSDCFLLRLGPDPMAIYRPTAGGDTFGSNNNTSYETRNYMYYNPASRSKGYDGLSHGIGFGGSSDLPRLYIDEVLDGCRAASEDLTFEKGALLSGLNESSASHFEVEAIEAWGVGTSQIVEEALTARDDQRIDKQKQIRKAMKGAKGQFLEDFQSGLTGNKLFQHRDQIQGREGDCSLGDTEEEET